MTEIAILSLFLIAFAIGSNDASNALSISIGADAIGLKRAIFLFGFLVFLGILFSSGKVMKTVGKNLVTLNPKTLSISFLVSALLVIISNLKKFPLSTHQVIIGTLVGSASASHSPINFFSLFKIFTAWIISPLVALLISFFLYKLLEKFIYKIPYFRLETLLKSFLLISASIISYNTGANELATVIGPVIYSQIFINKYFLFSFSAFLVFLGAYLLSYRVIETVGKGIAPLSPFSGFVAQLGAGISVFFFTFLGMPVSTTYCIIGSISGVGMTKGIHTVRMDLLKNIAINWIITLISAFILSFIFTLLIIS